MNHLIEFYDAIHHAIFQLFFWTLSSEIHLLISFISFISICGLLSDKLVDWLSFQTNNLKPCQSFKLITYGFVHADILHLALNMFALHAFGKKMAANCGIFTTLTIFIVGCSIPAIIGFLQTKFDKKPINIIGASAGVYALLAASILLNPNENVSLFGFGNFLAIHILIGILAYEAFSAFFRKSGVWHTGHILGAICGACLINVESIKQNLTTVISWI